MEQLEQQYDGYRAKIVVLTGEQKSLKGELKAREALLQKAEMKVVESYYSKKMVVSYASEAAEMIVRVDDIIKAAPRKRTTDNHPC